jgi:hypothetical protein
MKLFSAAASLRLNVNPEELMVNPSRSMQRVYPHGLELPQRSSVSSYSGLDVTGVVLELPQDAAESERSTQT